MFENKDISGRILYEDNHILIVNKLPSEIVQGDKSGDIPLSEHARRYVALRYNKPGAAFLGVVHRLDRPVSGAVLFARTSKSLSRLNVMLRERRIQKTYWAVVKEPPPLESARLVHYLTRNEKQNKTYVSDNPRNDASEASLSYKLLASSDNYHLLEVDLHTGRHHQIRAQLAHIGCPIRGDLKYGYPRSNEGGFIHLHSVRVSFVHPVRKALLTITALPPQDAVWDYFSKLLLPQSEGHRPEMPGAAGISGGE